MSVPPTRLEMVDMVISGGQTGVDRAALDVAITQGFKRGGWCPAGRRAEDGPIALKYPLVETESSGYRQRTKRNVLESDGTLILNLGPLDGGTLETHRIAERAGKPVHVVALEDTTWDTEIAMVREWLREHRIHILNVAGPKESKRPGIYAQAQAFLTRLAEASRPAPGVGYGQPNERESSMTEAQNDGMDPNPADPPPLRPLADLAKMIAERVNPPGETIRTTIDKVRKRMLYAVKIGALHASPPSLFYVPQVEAWAKGKWPSEFSDIPRYELIEVADRLVASARIDAQIIPGDLDRCRQELRNAFRKIEEANDLNDHLQKQLKAAQDEIDLLRPLAERYEYIRKRNRMAASRPRKTIR